MNNNNNAFYTEDIEIFKGIIKEKTNHGIVVSAINSNPFSKETKATKTVNQSYIDYSHYFVGQAVVVTTYKTVSLANDADPMHPSTVSDVRIKVEPMEKYAQRTLEEAAEIEKSNASKIYPSYEIK